MDVATLGHYKRFRAHQFETWDRDSNSGGSAWPGEHASAALRSARMQVNFMKRLEAYCAPAKRNRKSKR